MVLASLKNILKNMPEHKHSTVSADVGRDKLAHRTGWCHDQDTCLHFNLGGGGEGGSEHVKRTFVLSVNLNLLFPITFFVWYGRRSMK